MSANNVVLVGIAGFEPATFRPPDGRATWLRYTPMIWPFVCDVRSMFPGILGLTADGSIMSHLALECIFCT